MTARILVVDDIPANVRLLEAKLTAEYFEVLTANDGFSALEAAQAQAPDLILLDVMMPGMDGFEVATRLKSDIKTRHIPIIVLTAHKVEPEKIKAVSPGNIPVVTKSEGFVRLMNLVERLV